MCCILCVFLLVSFLLMRWTLIMSMITSHTVLVKHCPVFSVPGVSRAEEMLCVCAVSVYVHKSAGAHQGQKRVLDPPKLELQVIVRCQAWVLGAELRSSTKGV